MHRSGSIHRLVVKWKSPRAWAKSRAKSRRTSGGDGRGRAARREPGGKVSAPDGGWQRLGQRRVSPCGLYGPTIPTTINKMAMMIRTSTIENPLSLRFMGPPYFEPGIV